MLKVTKCQPHREKYTCGKHVRTEIVPKSCGGNTLSRTRGRTWAGHSPCDPSCVCGSRFVKGKRRRKAASDQAATVQVAVTAGASSAGGTAAACPGRLGRGRAAQRAPGRTAPRLPSPDGNRQLARSGPAERSAEQSCRTGVQPVRRRRGMGGTRPMQGVPAGGNGNAMRTCNKRTLIPTGWHVVRRVEHDSSLRSAWLFREAESHKRRGWGGRSAIS